MSDFCKELQSTQHYSVNNGQLPQEKLVLAQEQAGEGYEGDLVQGHVEPNHSFVAGG